MNRKAERLWQDYLAETDPTAAEMLYLQYLQALREATPETPGERDDIAGRAA
jgi:hypothetical protein